MTWVSQFARGFHCQTSKTIPLAKHGIEFCSTFPAFLSDRGGWHGKQIYSGEYLNTWHTFWCKHPCCQIKSFSYLQKSNHLKLKRFDLEKPINVLSIIINCKHHRCLANRSDSREYWNTWDNFVPLLELDWKIENNQSYDKKYIFLWKAVIAGINYKLYITVNIRRYVWALFAVAVPLSTNNICKDALAIIVPPPIQNLVAVNVIRWS